MEAMVIGHSIREKTIMKGISPDPIMEPRDRALYAASIIDNYALYIANFPNRIKKRKNREAIIKKYTRHFIIKLNTSHFCGNDEYVSPRDVIELLAVSALCKILVKLIDDQNEFGETELKRVLDTTSQKAIEAVFDNIPYREVKEANSICIKFMSIIRL